MPRGNRSQLPAVAFSVEHGEEAEEENSMDSSSEEEHSNHVEEEVFNDFEIDVDKTSEDGTGSDVVHRVRTVSDEVLTFLGTACMDRMTDSGVQRMICSQPPNVRDEVLHLWKTGFSGLSRHFICNQCGQDVLERTSCCGDVLTYFRVGGYSQLEDITKENLEDILKLRADLRTGKEKNHNLCGDFLKTLWQSENGDMLKISLIGSIDGVSLNGNTNEKLWPITFIVADLPVGEMQRAHNLILNGIVTGPSNPSTIFWNRVIPMVYSDIESKTTETKGVNICFSICSWVADQPAKRALFGMKHSNSENSCFFGMCSGTFYKVMGPNRSEERPNELTEQDALLGMHGFGNISPRIVEYLHPYDTVIDVLHTASEGLFPLIMNEVTRTGQLRSDMFLCDKDLHEKICADVVLPPEFDIQNLTNCSEKLAHFRTKFGIASLVNPSLSSEARLTITSLMLVLNHMYTNAPFRTPNFFTSLTAAPRWALGNASQSYMTTKTHELLCHLPEAVRKFGNVAAISTFGFEHFYKHCLKGFSPQKTRGFTESAITRVLLHSAVRREIRSRSATSPSVALNRFLAATPTWAPFQLSWKHEIRQLKREHNLPSISGLTHFSSLNLPIGKLRSQYRTRQTKSEIFFATNNSGDHCCYIFICFSISSFRQKILGERIRSVAPDKVFPLLQKMVDDMPRPGTTYSFHVLNQFKRYDGMIHGKATGEVELLDVSDVKGMGGFLKSESDTYYFQLNGASVHH